VYESPEQLFQAHWTSVPTATVLAEGLKLLFVTAIPPAGGVVFPLGWLLGAVEPPPEPPHAPAEIKASAIHTFLVLMTFSPLRVAISTRTSESTAFV
jgi:hypothetical protein